MIKIKPDREGLLTQWDLNRRIQITGLEDISNTEIHFSKPDDTKGAYVVLPVIENGIAFADIPNILLTVSGRIDVCVYRDDHTCVRGVFVVAPREKPDDYVYTETEVWRYEKLVEQLNGKEDTANRVTTVDDSSDDKHYPTAKAVYKAIPKSLKNPYSLTFTGAVTGSYDGSKPMTFNIPSGGSGTDISLGLTGAAVGDIIKVKAVDADGKPTEWVAAEMPSGDNYELINDVTIEDWVCSITINQDSSGNAFALKKMIIFMTLPKTTTEDGTEQSNPGYAYYAVNNKRPAFQNPAGGWESSDFMWKIEALKDYYSVECFKVSQFGSTLFHSHSFKSVDAFETLTSFEWRLFNGNYGWNGVSFKVYGVRA